MAASPPSPSPAPASPAADARASGRIRQAWQRRGPLACALWPLSLVYGALSGLQRWSYRSGLRRAQHPGVPVIVVGNVIAGGAGKTPVTQAIVRHLLARGLQPGIVSRGHGRTIDARHPDCRPVPPDAHAAEVGDEPLLLARSTGVPVFVARRRIAAARALLAAHPGVDVIVCDDGLQHLALARDVEVCVFHDGGIGNGWLLPAGPLREPWPRAVDAVLHAGPRPARTPAQQPCFALRRQLAPYALRADGRQVPLAQLQGQPLHALAAVARPEQFFAMLQAQGLTLAHTEALPDHYHFESWQRPAGESPQLICTEKDAVKLWPLVPDALAVPLQVALPDGFFALLDQRLSLSSGHSSPKNPI